MLQIQLQSAPENSYIIENHITDIDLPVYNDRDGAAISIQPQNTDHNNAVPRRPIPVSTVDWQTTNISQFIPLHGLDFLRGAEQLYIQQTIELTDLLAHLESESRYTVKVPHGETLYYAAEQSSSFQRLCFGTSRSFVMKLYDQTQQEALQFRRRSSCIFCYAQSLEVWLSPGDFVGVVKQQLKLSVPTFNIYNRDNDIVYRIEGPHTFACTSLGKDAHFKIFTADGMTQVGSVNHQWDQLQVAYNLCVQFPSRTTDTKHKALLLGAAFLLEYMYYQGSKLLRCRC
ncbi:hypothetical protein PPYR_05860 [Photinus pyralis]|uniref:Phospholipid scramblase n=1 Tax=Photinus pyralis TaxID=7054 RepID=A0A1Y1NF14_PHOPY|nr:phospholipid scramblase 2-like isoform X1 [Photinus pyralis]XP_031336079.1 phospholipid scramblase 2-like isoform X1 [Photinus pyralis]KAB0801506.1 hypothetical protein PPYR_05860 [Photinus pyralis]